MPVSATTPTMIPAHAHKLNRVARGDIEGFERSAPAEKQRRQRHQDNTEDPGRHAAGDALDPAETVGHAGVEHRACCDQGREPQQQRRDDRQPRRFCTPDVFGDVTEAP
jgi:hypothetical protein